MDRKLIKKLITDRDQRWIVMQAIQCIPDWELAGMDIEAVVRFSNNWFQSKRLSSILVGNND